MSLVSSKFALRCIEEQAYRAACPIVTFLGACTSSLQPLLLLLRLRLPLLLLLLLLLLNLLPIFSSSFLSHFFPPASTSSSTHEHAAFLSARCPKHSADFQSEVVESLINCLSQPSNSGENLEMWFCSSDQICIAADVERRVGVACEFESSSESLHLIEKEDSEKQILVFSSFLLLVADSILPEI